MNDTFRIGDLAKRTGLTVRALDYYDEIGLLSPSEKGANGYRLYTAKDVVRLQQIKSLSQLGFTLDQIKECLTQKDFSPLKVMEMHSQFLEKKLKDEKKLLKDLDGMMRLLKTTKPSTEDFLEMIETMHAFDDYFTQDQRAELDTRAKKLGRDHMVAVENEWPVLMEEARKHLKKGTDPKDPAMQKIAKRWKELIAEFTGGNPEIEKSLKKMYTEKPKQMQQFGGPDAELREYVQKAMSK